ncbi:MAG: hypothetical protein ACKVS6_14610 [Planctomycetota bacterium]
MANSLRVFPYLAAKLAAAKGILTLTSAVLAGVVAGFGDANAQGPKAGQPNDNTPKPGVFLNGPVRFGRLVDVWALDAIGNPGPILKKKGAAQIIDTSFLDMVVGEAIGVSKTLVTTVDPPVSLTLQNDAVSGATILVLGAQFEKSPKSRFQLALKEITTELGTVAVGSVNALPPYSVVPRDAAVVLNFDRPLNPKTIGPESIQFFVGTTTASGQLPPSPFSGRYIWKPERPKTVIFDPAVSALDDTRIGVELDLHNVAPSKNPNFNPQILPLNPAGLPMSLSSTTFNAAVFIPAQYNIIAGVNRILLGRDGTALDTNKSLTKFNLSASGAGEAGIVGAVRVFRSGGSIDANKGFLADPTLPQLLGTQLVTIQQVSSSSPNPNAPNDSRQIKFVYNNTFCDLSIHIGDSFQQGNTFAQVAQVFQDTLTDGDPSYTVVVNYLQSGSVFNAVDPSIVTTPFAPALVAQSACFVSMLPAPVAFGATVTGVDPQATFLVRFSKAMDFTNLNPLRNFVVAINSAITNPLVAGNFDLAIGNIIPAPDLKSAKFVPYLPLPHTNGTTETLRLIFSGGTAGISDLVGNTLDLGATSLNYVFQLNASAATNTSRNLSIRYDSLFETGAAQKVSGQVSKPSATEIGGRAPTHFSREADASNVMVAAMGAPTVGITTPFSALGARLQTVYRNVDVNLTVGAIDEIDLDVEGLSWAPFSGLLNTSDFFQHIRIDMAHSLMYPDELWSPVSGNMVFPGSGLLETSFDANVFQIAQHPSVAVYEGVFSLNPNLLFTASSGTVCAPFPKFTKTYTWRDSSYGPSKVGAPGGVGVNPDQYFLLTTGATPGPTAPNINRPWGAGAVPSVGLPLLVDMRIYPADDPNTKGLNGFLVVDAALNLGPGVGKKPNFSVWSEGGLDANFSAHTTTPDVAPDGVNPVGGYFPPGSTQGPPGTKTPPGAANFYVARLDFGVKVSRAYSHYYAISTATVTNPTFKNTNILMLPSVQPANTSVVLKFRGADNSTGLSLTDARCFDAYGGLYANTAIGTAIGQIPQPLVGTCSTGGVTAPFPDNNSDSLFTPDITLLNGKKFIQFQFNFIADIVNNVGPRVNALGVAFSNP